MVLLHLPLLGRHFLQGTLFYFFILTWFTTPISLPGSLFFLSPAPREQQKTDPGNEIKYTRVLLENLKSKEQWATLDNLKGKKERKEFNDVVNKTATLCGRLTSTDKKGYAMLKTSALLLLFFFFAKVIWTLSTRLVSNCCVSLYTDTASQFLQKLNLQSSVFYTSLTALANLEVDCVS